MERHITGVALASIFMLMTLVYGKYGEDNFVFHVNNPEHLDEALTTADSLTENENIKLHRAELIVCGEAVKSLVENADTMKLLKEINPEHVQLTLCEASVEKHDIDLDNLPFEVNVIRDSEGRFEKLQNVGYKEIEI